jgi:hypothetical protein
MPRRQRMPRTAICRDQTGRDGQDLRQRLRVDMAATDKGDRGIGVDNDVLHEGIAVLSGNRSQSRHKMIR